MNHFRPYRDWHVKGFTLVELLIVVAILGLLAAIAVPQLSAYRTRSYNAVAVSDLRNIRTLEQAFFTDFASYAPATLGGGVLNFTYDGVTVSSFNLSRNVRGAVVTDQAVPASITPAVTYTAGVKNTQGDWQVCGEAEQTVNFWQSPPGEGIGYPLAAGDLPPASNPLANDCPGTPL